MSQCLEVSPHRARAYDERIRRLLGYARHRRSLGHYRGGDPVWVDDG